MAARSEPVASAGLVNDRGIAFVESAGAVHRGLAGVDHERVSRDVSCLVAGQVKRSVCYVARQAGDPEWRPGGDVLRRTLDVVVVSGDHPSRHRRDGVSGRDGIHPNAVARQLRRNRFRETDHAVFGSGVNVGSKSAHYPGG